MKIIEEVVSASQTDFEENGVNQQTLVELQQVSLFLVRCLVRIGYTCRSRIPISVSYFINKDRNTIPTLDEELLMRRLVHQLQKAAALKVASKCRAEGGA